MSKLVKEYLNEKFELDSDPIHDLGIGISYIINKSFENIFKMDYMQNYFKDPFDQYRRFNDNTGFQYIRVYTDGNTMVYECRLYSNAYYDNNYKPLDKKEYLKKLLDEANILQYMTDMIYIDPYQTDYSNSWAFKFIVNPKFEKYFKTGSYYPTEYNIT